MLHLLQSLIDHWHMMSYDITREGGGFTGMQGRKILPEKEAVHYI